MKILCCNIRVDVPVDAESGNGWDDRKGLFLEVIRAQNADVICLQECRQAHYQYLKRGLPEYESFGLANPDTAFNPTNAIFFARARFEMISAGGFWLSETPHIPGSKSWDSARPRFVNYVDLRDDSGKEFRVWNGHLDHIGQVARENQARLITEASDALPENLSQLFTADLNAEASNPAVQNLLAGGWTDTYTAIHGPDDPGFTYHRFIGPAYDGKTRGKIDFILCRGPVEVTAADIIRDCRDDHYPSDHYFISAEVKI